MNCVLAVAAGVLKDCNEAGDEARAQSPILSHPRFEQLEAVGEARGHAARLRKALASGLE
jgi:hypothetical protein